MFNDDGLWPCKCSACEHEWYSSIAAMRADGEVACPSCDARNFVPLADFDSAVLAARTGRYDFSYLVHIPAQFQSGLPTKRAA
jgi:DNA-directed RNA polymerase subunit RPC12/RpoP